MGSLRSSQYDSPVHSQNLSEWVKTSIMGDYNPASFDYVPEHSSSSRGQTDLLVYKAQQLIAQPRSFDDCTCSSYSSDAPNCTCDAVKTENSKPRYYFLTIKPVFQFFRAKRLFSFVLAQLVPHGCS